MKPLPSVVLQLLATLPDAQAQKIVLNTDGNGHWEVEVFSRYRLDEPSACSAHVPLKDKAPRHLHGVKKRG